MRDPRVLPYLSEVLASLGENLTHNQASDAAKIILNTMQTMTDSRDFPSLGKAIESLGANLPSDQVVDAAKIILNLMQNTTDFKNLTSLSETLAVLTVSISDKDIPSVLNSIVCAGSTQEKVISSLEKKTNQEFNEDLWKAVAWLKEKGIDIIKIPRFPTLSQESPEHLKSTLTK